MKDQSRNKHTKVKFLNKISTIESTNWNLQPKNSRKECSHVTEAEGEWEWDRGCDDCRARSLYLQTVGEKGCGRMVWGSTCCGPGWRWDGNYRLLLRESQCATRLLAADDACMAQHNTCETHSLLVDERASETLHAPPIEMPCKFPLPSVRMQQNDM